MALPIQKRCAVLMLQDGTIFNGYGFGYNPQGASGEICFNTSISGYQEVLTDPSYKGQIVVFTAPHIGNTGTNNEDIESKGGRAVGLVTREKPTPPANFRNQLARIAKHCHQSLREGTLNGKYGNGICRSRQTFS